MDSTESITSSKPTTSSSRLEPIPLWPPGAGKELGGEFVLAEVRKHSGEFTKSCDFKWVITWQLALLRIEPKVRQAKDNGA